MIQGYEEFIDQYDYTLTFTTKPADVYNVGIVGYNTRLATRWATTSAPFTTNLDTTVRSAFPAGKKLWVQPQDEPWSFPFDIYLGGARLRVISTGDVRNANSNLKTDLTNWVADTGAMVYVRSLSTGAMRRNVGKMTNNTGGTIRIGARSTGTVTAGEDYQASAFVKVSADTTHAGVNLFWLNGGGATIGSVGGSELPLLAADDWQHFYIRGAAPVGAVSAYVLVYAEMANTQLMWWGNGRIIHASSMTTSPQRLTVEPAAINGVAKVVG